tara:strand:+ start:46181 stop:47161 length:981 start_codon:yes stop_codon:yes gene_type:complete
MKPSETKQLCLSVLKKEQKEEFGRSLELDLSFGVRGLGRFRANLFMQRSAVSGTFRSIPFKIRTLDELGVPKIASELARRPNGLVLVTGPTGSGKSTTLAALIDIINHQRYGHIVTIEDPIEYLHQHRNCIINQREVGTDTHSFSIAIRRVLRQDPDVVLIGEMRDLESIEATLTLAETGHLVLASLHTNSAIQTVNRIVDVFPPHQQQQIRIQLSYVLEGVICQQLMHKVGGGRILASEVLICNPAIRNLIRDDKLHQIYTQMQVGQGKHGMMTMNQSLYDLYMRKLISWEDALGRSPDSTELKQMTTHSSAQKMKSHPRSPKGS